MRWEASSASIAPSRGGPATGDRTSASTQKASPARSDAERWLKVSEAESLTGRWVAPAAGAEPFGPYAEEWIAVKRSTVGETTAFNTESLLRARVLPEFGAKRLKILEQAVDDGLLVSNPAKKAKGPSVRPRRQLILSADELRQLADECGDFAPLVWFLG